MQAKAFFPEKWAVLFYQWKVWFAYCKVTSRSTSRLVARPRIFRLFMKGKFDPYVLWPLSKSPKLNSRPVYCPRLYGTYQVKQIWRSDLWNRPQAENSQLIVFSSKPMEKCISICNTELLFEYIVHKRL